MDLLRETRALQERSDRTRSAGGRVGLVPTMGALHAGHLSLIEEARRRVDSVGVSIFVNPSQFNAAVDLLAYPRTLEADLEVCEGAGVEWVFVPSAEEIYPEGFQTWIDVEELAKPLCGAARPGHFRGVATIVAKLFLAAKPHVAVFGEKDYQQLALIRRMARDLAFDVEVVGAPTLRESDGLAMSSRNVHLSNESRGQASALVRALDAAESAIRGGEHRTSGILAVVAEELAKAPLAEVDYAELRDPESLAALAGPLHGASLLALAVFFPRASDHGEVVRLIDNRVLPPPHPPGQDRPPTPTEERT